MTSEPSERILSRDNLLSLYLPALTLALGTGIAAPALPVFAKSFDVTFGEASLVVIVHMVGSLVASVPTGLLMDRLGRRKVLLSGPVLVAIASFLTAIAQSFPELLLYRFVGGWAQQMWSLTRLAIIADTVADRQRGRQITSMYSVETVGRLLGPAVGGLIAAFTDVRVPFVIHGLLSLLAIIPSFRLIKDTTPAAEPASGQASARSTFTMLLAFPILMFFVAQFMASLTRGTLFSGNLDVYAVFAYDIGPEVIGFMAAAASATGIPIMLVAGAVMDRFGRKATIVPGFTLLGVALAFAAVTVAAQWPFTVFVLAYLLIHSASNITSGNMQTLGSDIAPAHARGRFFGVWRTVSDVGQVLSPAVFALLESGYGDAASFVFLAASSIGAALVVGTQVREPLRERAVAH